jgi:RNA polymerase sigma factor (TIGR02999 family)
MDEAKRITRLLSAWRQGDDEALKQVFPLVETELRRLARIHMAGEKSNHILQPTALVNELYLKLSKIQDLDFRDRTHFFSFAARTMRRILVDYARQREAQKRRPSGERLPLEEVEDPRGQRDRVLLALDDSLHSLAEIDERQSRVVELHYFTGLSSKEIGEILKISERTVKREMHTARLWLSQAMRTGGAQSAQILGSI